MKQNASAAYAASNVEQTPATFIHTLMEVWGLRALACAAALLFTLPSPSIANDGTAALVGSWKVTSSSRFINGVDKDTAVSFEIGKTLILRADGSGELRLGGGVIGALIDAAIPSTFTWKYDPDHLKLSLGTFGSYKAKLVDGDLVLTDQYTSFSDESISEKIVLVFK